MKRLPLFACVVLFVATVLKASPVPDFWYVLPDETSAASASRLVRGIVIPSSVNPTVETTPAGSVVSWHRPDGTRQSLVVQGVSSFTFERGPLVGTTYVPFGRSRQLEYTPDGCCSCASWQNSVESVEALSCVVGCNGCGCEGCICSPTFPCPGGPGGAMTLVANNDSTAIMTFGRSGANKNITVLGRGRASVRFQGRHLAGTANSKGETVINEPDSIVLSGTVAARAAVRGDRALFAWSSPTASVILEQPRSMPAPSFHDGAIDFDTPPDDGPATMAKHLEVAPVTERCKACGTHPNSDADLDIYDCVPGNSVCYRCVSWECFAPES
jgi:hypothetical protein